MELLQMESIVTTQLKVRVPKVVVRTNPDITIHDMFPKLSFSNEISETTPSFPNIYIHELEPSEIGNSLENQTIHAIRDTIQVDVSTNTNKSDGRIVANAVVKAMKEMRYSTTMLPMPRKQNNVHVFTIRFRRIIANGDSL